MVAASSYLVQGKQYFGMVVPYRLKRCQFAFEGGFIKNRSGYLKIGESLL